MGLNAQAIGLRIQQARVAKGMTQADLALALGIDRGSVGRWETGKSVPKQVGIPRVAQVLGQTPDWLLEGSGDFHPHLAKQDVVPKKTRAPRKASSPAAKANVTKLPKPKMVLPKEPKNDRIALEDIMKSWDSAKPEARLIAALFITGDWSYKLKLMNREVCIDEEVLSLLGNVTA